MEQIDLRDTLHKITISQELLDSARPIFKFGKNDGASGNFEELWTASTPYPYLAAATQLNISSDNANDTLGGTGLNTLVIRGLDENFVEIEEQIELDGQNAVVTANSYFRINDFIGLTGGTTGTHEGTIYAGTGALAAGVPAVVLAEMPTTDVPTGIAQMAIFTIPAGKVGLLANVNIFTDQGSNAEIAFRIKTDGRIPLYLSTIILYQATLQRNFPFFFAIEEKTDIALVAKSLQGNIKASGSFELLLVDKK